MLSLSDMRSHPSFTHVREAVEKAGSGSVCVFGGTYHGGYYSQQNPDEFAALVCYLMRRCRPIDLYGEIGVAAGGTTRLMHELVSFRQGLLLDNGQHPDHRHFAENTKNIPLRVFIGDSHSNAAKGFLAIESAKEPNPKFDVIFIDGDHTYEGVKQDIELVKPYCSPATLLIFHDTVACAGVRKAFDELPNKLAEFVSEEKKLGIGVARYG